MEYLIQGLLLGLGVGLAPGPLLALVISASLRGGTSHGLRVAFSPLITDLPIIVVSLFILRQINSSALGFLSIIGAIVLFYFAYESWIAGKNNPQDFINKDKSIGSTKTTLFKAILTNFINPSAWLFWMTAGGTLLVNGWNQSFVDAAGFLVGFYLLLIGSKVLLAFGIGSTRNKMPSWLYKLLVRIASILLLVLGIELIRSSLNYF
jgi:threonine/homoserine/homoserine lactone efflux protein